MSCAKTAEPTNAVWDAEFSGCREPLDGGTKFTGTETVTGNG